MGEDKRIPIEDVEEIIIDMFGCLLDEDEDQKCVNVITEDIYKED